MTRLLILITLNIFYLNNLVLAQSPKLSDKVIKKWVENYMNYAVKFDHFAGVVFVAHNGKTVFSNAYGKANYELNVPNNLDTKFRIGSISKTFTAAAITKLYQENKINLDSSICPANKMFMPAWGSV